MPVCRQPSGRLETGLLSQTDVDQHDVRPQRLGALDRLGGVMGYPGHRHPAAFQQGLGNL
jgi:hypothetical protein